MTPGGDISVGDEILIRSTFTTPIGAGADPSAVVFKLKRPDDVIETFSLGHTRESAGVYSRIYVPTMGGVFKLRVEGTGAVPATADTTFTVIAASV